MYPEVPQGEEPMPFNPVDHKLVPEHRLLSEEEAASKLAGMALAKDQLPKIKRTDPVVQLLERIHGPIPEGRIIRIVRRSETAGVSEAFRLVVDR